MSGTGTVPGSGVAPHQFGADVEEGGTGSNTIYIPPPPVSSEAGEKADNNSTIQQCNPVESNASGGNATTPAVTSSEAQIEEPHDGANVQAPSGAGPAAPVDLLDNTPPTTSVLPAPVTDATESPVTDATSPSAGSESTQVSGEASATTGEEKQQKYAEAPMQSSLHELD